MHTLTPYDPHPDPPDLATLCNPPPLGGLARLLPHDRHHKLTNWRLHHRCPIFEYSYYTGVNFPWTCSGGLRELLVALQWCALLVGAGAANSGGCRHPGMREWLVLTRQSEGVQPDMVLVRAP